MIIRKGEAQIFGAGSDCEVTEYGGVAGLFDLGVAAIRGEYPQDGKWARNNEVEAMTYFVTEGQGRFSFRGSEFQDIATGDLVVIRKGQWYRVEAGKEGLRVVMFSTPPWSLDQYEVKSDEEIG